jgi:hypothetical protein
MRTQLPVSVFRATLAAFIGLLALAPRAGAQAPETISATAHVKTSGGVEASAPVQITVTRFSNDRERDQLLAALRKDGTSGVQALLAKAEQVESVQVGSSQTPIKYIYARTSAGGRLITVLTGTPIAFVGAAKPDAPPKAGFDLGLVMLEVGSGGGKGEMVPAAKVKLNAQDAIVTEDYSAEVVRLSNVVKK